MIAGAAGIVLFLVMFLDWYGVSAEGFGVDISVGGNAWEVFSLIDLILFLVAAVAIAQAVLRATGNMPTGLPAPPAMIVAGAGALAVLLILFRLIVSPVDTDGLDGVDVSRKIGIFLGLIAAGAITFGGYTAMKEREEGTAPPPAA